MNSQDAIGVGGLANNARFFGTNTSETKSIAAVGGGSWNSDWSQSVYANEPWFFMDGPADGVAGIFGSAAEPGQARYNVKKGRVFVL